jgi:hypothetical protein
MALSGDMSPFKPAVVELSIVRFGIRVAPGDTAVRARFVTATSASDINFPVILIIGIIVVRLLTKECGACKHIF